MGISDIQNPSRQQRNLAQFERIADIAIPTIESLRGYGSDSFNVCVIVLGLIIKCFSRDGPWLSNDRVVATHPVIITQRLMFKGWNLSDDVTS